MPPVQVGIGAAGAGFAGARRQADAPGAAVINLESFR